MSTRLFPSRLGATERSPHAARSGRSRGSIVLSFLALCLLPMTMAAQVNGIGSKPYLGWSTYSQQTIVASPTVMNEANILAQSDALHASGLQEHGYQYINLDSGWSAGHDQYGRTLWDSNAFPHFLEMIKHIHVNGQKVGIYMNPGLGTDVVAANLQILGTSYHLQDIIVKPATIANAFGGGDKIDYSQPGAQDYINSVISLYASWGVDFIKLDAVTPGSYNDNTTIDNRGDVAAISKAIALSGRPIWFTISWALDEDYISDWQQYSNARRIEGDVECEGDCPLLTEWPRVEVRFLDLPSWQDTAGPELGWNDLDSLEVGNGTTDGINDIEQQTAMTLWAMANAPLSLGGDLTKLTDFGKKILGNDEVIAVDQSGHPAKQVAAGFTPVWVQDLGHGTYNVALFNLNAAPVRVTLPWKDLGFFATLATRDLWSHQNLGPSLGEFSAVIPGHGERLLKVQGVLSAPASKSQIYEAELATLTGSTQISQCANCSGGENITFLGIGPNNNAFFNDVKVAHSGVYRMEVDSSVSGTRSFIINVNGGPDITLNSSGGGSAISKLTIPVSLHEGNNSIEFGNPTSYPPDLDRIVISGDGLEPYPDFRVYEAENATLSGNVVGEFCGSCSGLAKAGNVGGGSSVTFEKVTAPASGYYNMEIDYLTSGLRSYFISVNGGEAKELDLNGTSFGSPASTTLKVYLKAGVNQIEFGNPSNAAPDLDSITISPLVE